MRGDRKDMAKNSDGPFRDLDYKSLKSFAKGLAVEYEIFRRITLHRNLNRRDSVKYVVVCETCCSIEHVDFGRFLESFRSDTTISFRTFLNKEFADDVYSKGAPQYDFRDEWSFWAKSPNEGLPENINDENVWTLFERIPADEKKLRPSQKHKIKCREVAQELWKEDPELTIVDVIGRKEINDACERIVYSDKTIRIWINSLCPNRDPGRRPKKNSNLS